MVFMAKSIKKAVEPEVKKPVAPVPEKTKVIVIGAQLTLEPDDIPVFNKILGVASAGIPEASIKALVEKLRKQL